MERSHSDRSNSPPIALSNSTANQGYFLSAKVNNNLITLLLDTGANATILSKNVIEKWPYATRPNLTPVATTLITVTGETTPFLGRCDVEICLGKQTIEHSVLIADIEMDGVLGLDFLLSHQCDLMLSKGYITLKGEMFYAL
ncbi:MAG: retroviral-like aspartic protease family protein [Sedimenticola sp.]